MRKIKFIVGGAGMGKTTRLSQAATDKSLVLTPTHMAAKVLIGKGVKNVYTIHSVLKLVPTINMNFRSGERLQVLKKVGATDLDTITDVLVDEFSMINVEIFNILLEVLPEHANITVFGDPYQLPPIDGEKIVPSSYTEDIEELTVQHRSEAPEVVETFMRYMQYIKDKSERDLSFNKNIKYGDLSNFNPETDRCLAYTNLKVSELNNNIAEILGLPKTFSALEPVFVANIGATITKKHSLSMSYPMCVAKGDFLDPEEHEKRLTEVVEGLVRWGTDLSNYPKLNILLDDDRVFCIHYDIDYYENAKRFKKDVETYQELVVSENELSDDVELPKWCRENRDAPYVKDRAVAWSNYLNHQNYVFPISRPYASTVHKAQGQEFRRIYIAYQDMKLAVRGRYYEQYARLMYVALSRAISEVIILEGH